MLLIASDMKPYEIKVGKLILRAEMFNCVYFNLEFQGFHTPFRVYGIQRLTLVYNESFHCFTRGGR